MSDNFTPSRMFPTHERGSEKELRDMVEPTARGSAMEELTEYNKEIRQLDEMLKPFMLPLALVDLDILHRGLNLVETVAPLLTPSEYMHGGSRNVEQQRKFIHAVTPLVSYAKSLLPPTIRDQNESG